MKDRRRVPERWRDYHPIGKVVSGSRFLPFKTPLRPEILIQLVDEEHFNIEQLQSKVTEMGHRLGLIIDLTDTDRYYDPMDFHDLLIPHYKINFPGTDEQEIDEEIVDKFIQRVDVFLHDNKKNDLLIGVHCTHGVNRTGYLIGRYLIERQQLTSHEALEVFRKARGVPIEREKFIRSLHSVSQRLHNRPLLPSTAVRRDRNLLEEFLPAATLTDNEGWPTASNTALLQEIFASSPTLVQTNGAGRAMLNLEEIRQATANFRQTLTADQPTAPNSELLGFFSPAASNGVASSIAVANGTTVVERPNNSIAVANGTTVVERPNNSDTFIRRPESMADCRGDPFGLPDKNFLAASFLSPPGPGNN